MPFSRDEPSKVGLIPRLDRRSKFEEQEGKGDVSDNVKDSLGVTQLHQMLGNRIVNLLQRDCRRSKGLLEPDRGFGINGMADGWYEAYAYLASYSGLFPKNMMGFLEGGCNRGQRMLAGLHFI